MSGESNATGRSGCLKANEVDPQGLASPCVTPTQSVQVTPSIQKLPTVGSDSNFVFIALVWGVAVAVLVYMVMSRHDRWK